jgi:hypothetical protein
MKILYFLALLFIILITPIHLFSQTFKKGYIVNSLNDTIKGYVKENTDEELVKALYFSKDGLKANFSKYETAQLKGFGFDDGRVFERFVLKEFNGKDSVENYYYAKKILSGKINAYTVESTRRGSEWILKNQKSGKVVHFKKPHEHQEKTADGKIVIATDYKYLQYLTFIKQDSPNTFVKQADIRYSKKLIVKNLKSYNLTFKDQYPMNHYKQQKQVAYGILGGFSIYPPVNLTSEEAKFSNGYRISGYRDVTWTEQIIQVAFTQGLSYSSLDYYNEGVQSSQVLSAYPVGVKFQFPPLRIMPYIYTGIGLTYVNSTEYLHSELLSNGNLLTVALNMGIGVKVKITSSWFVIAEASNKFLTEGMYLNGGVAYQFIKHKD